MTYRYHFVHTLYYSLVRYLLEACASAGQSCRIPRSTLAEGTVQWVLMTAVLRRCLAKAAQGDGPTKASTDPPPPPQNPKIGPHDGLLLCLRQAMALR